MKGHQEALPASRPLPAPPLAISAPPIGKYTRSTRDKVGGFLSRLGASKRIPQHECSENYQAAVYRSSRPLTTTPHHPHPKAPLSPTALGGRPASSLPGDETGAGVGVRYLPRPHRSLPQSSRISQVSGQQFSMENACHQIWETPCQH